MVYLNVKSLLEKNERKPYWLVKKLETNYTVVNKMIANQTRSISFEMIDKLCAIFDCEIQDLIIRKPIKDKD